ncbi:ParA family protein [Streptomyces polyrhachis]|uniref:ParA family protein n=1 Tax=Streptomyces polyrhachis TaxID=1282885 RepID=A0ABW2GPK3_9ACTN
MLDDDEEVMPEYDRDALGATFAVGNGKGGVGKTTVVSNVAGLAAADGARVLIVDINGQGNVGRDLGYRDSPEDDRGKGLVDALVHGKPLQPIANVRPNLDVVPGGEYVSELPDMLRLAFPKQKFRQVLALAISLAPMARQYDAVFIDSAPENPPLEQLALAAARWMIAPTKSDAGSIKDGLGDIARQFAVVQRKVNSSLGLLGVVLFASGSRSSQIRRRARDKIGEVLGSDFYMFESTIRHAEAVGVDARDRGLLVHELEVAAANNPAFWELRAGDSDKPVISKTSSSVAEDFAQLAREIFTRVAELEGRA